MSYINFYNSKICTYPSRILHLFLVTTILEVALCSKIIPNITVPNIDPTMQKDSIDPSKTRTGHSIRRASDNFPFLDFKQSSGSATGGGGGGDGAPNKNPGNKPTALQPCNPKDSGLPSKRRRQTSSGLDESSKKRLETQSRHLILSAHKIAIFGQEESVGKLEEQEPMNSFKLLLKTGEIFKKFCPATAVPASYIDTVIRSFMLLHRFMEPKRLKYLTDEETAWTIKLLEKCETQTPATFIMNTGCGDDILGETSSNTKICPLASTQFDYDNYDTLIDTIFKIFELSHSNCFESFQGFSRVWHRFTMGIQDLFSLQIKQRWGSALEKEKFWRQLLGPHFKDYGDNIDKCVHYYATHSPIRVRLPRTNQAFSTRYGPGVPDIFTKV